MRQGIFLACASHSIIVHYIFIKKRLLYYSEVTNELRILFGIPGIKYTKDGGFLMKQKKISKLVGLVGAACLSLGMFFCPVATLPTQAATPEVAVPCSEIIEWRYKIEDGKVYKRLYNYSRAEWIGDWIYLRDLPDNN